MEMLGFSLNSVITEGSRKGGFAPSQWVLGKFPRSPGDLFCDEEFADLGCVSEKIDTESAFYNLTQMRLACKKGFAETDCSKRVAKVILRKAAPLPGDYAVGDLICFKRESGATTP